ncbi:MAG: hypothetical protein WCH39_22650 [Schlesneria sp.]
MPTIMFQGRFAESVVDGTKRNTIRKVRKKNPIKVGDVLSHRQWSGTRAYEPGSTQIVLRVETCTRVTPIRIQERRCKLGTIWIDGMWRELLAKKDGFDDWKSLVAWFTETHGLPFEGVFIEWSITE